MGQDRAKLIVEFLKTNNLATVDDLVTLTGASPATIRRELVKMNEEGMIYRVHGGVTLNRFVPQQMTIPTKQHLHHQEKQAIGLAAAALIQNGDSVVLDAGTTAMEIARHIKGRPVRVITTDLRISLLLGESNTQTEVSVCGGTVDTGSQSCIGNQVVEYVGKLHPTYTFIACSAFKAETGITAPTSDLAMLKRALTRHSSKKVLVADSSKYGLTQLYEVGPLDSVDLIITDDKHDINAAAEIRRMGIELMLCSCSEA